MLHRGIASDKSYYDFPVSLGFICVGHDDNLIARKDMISDH